MQQSNVYVINTDEGYLNNNFNFSLDVFEACQFPSLVGATTIVEDAGDTMKNAKVVKILKTVQLTPVI